MDKKQKKELLEALGNVQFYLPGEAGIRETPAAMLDRLKADKAAGRDLLDAIAYTHPCAQRKPDVSSEAFLALVLAYAMLKRGFNASADDEIILEIVDYLGDDLEGFLNGENRYSVSPEEE